MGKTVYMFPGQGAQYVGMAKEFYDQLKECKEVFEMASDASGLDIPKLCFEENDQIHITEYTQIAMLTAEVAMLTALQSRGLQPQAAAGLSLGEYGALVAAGVMEPKDAFRVVRSRGIFMQQAVPEGGAMSAVLGLDAATIEELCEKTAGVVSIANYNCPGQIVITGESQAVADASALCQEAGAKRVVPLKVSGPFHSQMLTGAGEKLGEVLKDITLHDIAIPYVTNVTADYVTDVAQVKPLLVQQVSSSVRWQQSVERLIADGYDEFVEIGPGHTLAGFMKKIDRSIKTVNIEKWEDFTNYVGE
ncbi:MAG: ACP S-malonyltransferase [Lachnospiraceae bacterium]|nr:ACP S-malonyltransferase [Lachnospiraceae bacterium]